MSRIARLAALSFAEWKVLLAALFLLPYASLLLRKKGFIGARTALLSSGPLVSVYPRDQQLGEARRISRMVDVAARYGFYPATCLKRSLVLAWFLQRRGISFDLRIGVPKVGALNEAGRDFSAHAWVESLGVVVNEHEDVNDRFACFENHLDGQR